MLVFLLMVLVGCSSRRQPPPDVDLTSKPIMVAIPTNPPVVITSPSNPVPVVVPPASQLEFTETWVPLERWCQLRHLGAPRRIVTDNASVYSFLSTNGTMTIRIGSQNAIWRGTDYLLGFAPEVVKGHPCVHALDIRKNFIPLLEDRTESRSNRVLVIDPGHGGTDSGARNIYNGHFEKEFTLDLARRLQALLMTNGWTVWLTRTNDVNLSLPNRVAVADQHKADLFLSLHFNSSFPDANEAGLETYCVTPAGMPSNLTRGFVDDSLLVFPNNTFDTQNIQYAARLHRAVLKVNGHMDRAVRRARFIRVLREQNRPAVLMETGYLSNLREARRIAEPDYRQKVAEALAQALGENPVNIPVIAAPINALSPVTNQAAPPATRAGQEPGDQSD